ncbi:urease accessory protein UreD [Rhodobacteraceae bacterium LMO-12]|nr:urease accessory protein UreD [Rhodobacteraceae bacterium LMO-JJ12]
MTRHTAYGGNGLTQSIYGAFPITRAAIIPTPTCAAAQPRAIGAVMVRAKRLSDRSAIADLRQSGAMKLLFPRPDSAALQAIVVNTAGGVTGGDSFSLNACADDDAFLSLTTQAAERGYRAQPGQVAKIRNRVMVKRGATLHWLPQETILYEACALQRRLSVDLDDGASLLLVEPLVFGRAAMGEVLAGINFKDRIEIRRAGQPLYLDAISLQGDVTAHLASANIAAGAGALATIVYVAPDAEAHLPKLRALLPASGGASLLGSDLLVARILAQDSFELRRSLMPILRQLSADALPRSWMT